MIATSLRSCFDAGASRPDDACTTLIESSTVTCCSPLRLDVALGAPKARQDQRLAAGEHVRAVQLGRDVHGERAPGEGRRGHVAVRRGGGEVAAEADEHLGPAVAHRPDRVDHVPAVRAGRLEPELVPQPVEEGVRHLLPDAHRPVALHVAVPAHRAGPRARPADVAPQQQEVHHLADRLDRVPVLGQAHRPADDHAVRRDDVVGELLDPRPGQPAEPLDRRPVECAPRGGGVVEALRCGSR